jgi:hypothetical protein
MHTHRNRVFKSHLEATKDKAAGTQANAVCRWTVNDVAAFFTSLKLDECKPAIFENEIDGCLLLDLLADDGLADLGITNKVQKAKIKRGLDKALAQLEVQASGAGEVMPSNEVACCCAIQVLLFRTAPYSLANAGGRGSA